MGRAGRPTVAIELTDEERETLVRWSRRHSSSQAPALRSRIALACADGSPNTKIADELGCDRVTVGKWRHRSAAERLEGLVDAPRPGAARTISDEVVEAVVVETLETTPKGTCHDPLEALGRSRGGLTTKIHLGCDGLGRPLGVVLSPGQRHDSTQLGLVLDAIGVPRPCRRGRPRKRPGHLIADKGYSYPTCRRLLRRRGIPHTIPQRSDQRARRVRRPGRPLGFDRERYRQRNVVERCFNRLKQFRAVATRYDKRAVNYRAMVIVASLLIWLDG
jgi:transposase